VTLYLDTSSLVKLYVAETGADVVLDLLDRAAAVATSVIAYAETRAALARRRREGRLSASSFKTARRAFEDDWPAFLTLDVTQAISREAGDLAEHYRLRGYDSVHLASFAEVARRAEPGQTRFSSFDERLNRAARALTRASRQER
jgi:predicted nucleic acid-binding protein